jgi:hypothetical protein
MRLIRLCLLGVLLVGVAIAADAAQQRLVRVIWDVARGDVFYRAEPLIRLGQDTFVVPADATQARAQGFTLIGRRSLQATDVVRVIAVNYNPVSHVWDSSSTAVQIAKQPSIVPALLNAAVLAITGAAKLPDTSLTFSTKSLAPHEPMPTACGQLSDVRNALNTLNDNGLVLYSGAMAVVGEAHKIELSNLAKRLTDVSTNSKLSAIFDDRSAWIAIERDHDVFGIDFTERTSTLALNIKPIQSEIEGANTAMLAFDRALISAGTLSSTCADEAKKLVERRDNIAALIKEAAGSDSPMASVLAAFDSAGKLWTGYQQSLLQSTWTDEAIEIDVKDPLQADSVVRVEAVFASPDKTVTAKAQRSLVLGMKPDIPALVISAGVGYNRFQFKTLSVVKIAVPQSDGTTVAKDQLTVVDDTTWDPIVPVWLENIRIVGWEQIGIYGTFGTTPDRNIFKNAIVGGSVYVPRWRTTFTGGMIAARGYREDDLSKVVKTYSDSNGYALPDVTKDNVSLPPPRWKKSWYASVSFALASF